MHGSVGQMKRLKSWQNHLSGLGKVAPVTLHTVNGGNGVSVSLCMEQIIGAVRTKVLEVRYAVLFVRTEVSVMRFMEPVIVIEHHSHLLFVNYSVYWQLYVYMYFMFYTNLYCP